MGNQPAGVTQSRAQRLWSVTGRSGSSQAWAWTRAARFNLISDKKQRASGTPPRPTSTPHNIIRSPAEGRAGGLDLPQLSGEKYVSIFFPHFWCQRRPNKRCSVSLTIAHSFESLGSVSSPLVLTLKRFPRECVPPLLRLLHNRAAQAPGPNTSFRPPHRRAGHNWNDSKHFQTRAETWTVMPFSWILHKVKCHRCTPVTGYWSHRFRFLAPDKILSRISRLWNATKADKPLTEL